MSKNFIVSLNLLLSVLLSTSGNAQKLDDIFIDGKKCGLHGDAKAEREFNQNVFKNRYVSPTNSQIENSISIKDLIKKGIDENSFSQDQAVTLEGYVFDVKPGGIETCNCHAKKSLFKDTHIELTPNEHQTSPDKRVIVEITPRMRMIMQDQGVDWTTASIKDMILHRFVKVTGWLFYDGSHDKEAFASDPDDTEGRDNWRATCWEVHPVTDIEVETDMAEFTSGTDQEDDQSHQITPYSIPKKIIPRSSNASMSTNSPLGMLIIILLGAILGACGQGIRVIVGLKQVNDEAMKKQKAVKDILETKQIAISLLIAFCIGGVAGVLAAVQMENFSEFSKADALLFIGAGYAGTDFIEGFMKKYPQVDDNNVPDRMKPAPPSKMGDQGAIDQKNSA